MKQSGLQHDVELVRWGALEDAAVFVCLCVCVFVCVRMCVRACVHNKCTLCVDARKYMQCVCVFVTHLAHQQLHL